MNLYLIRGLPSAGKTTFARTISDNVYAADDYFEALASKEGKTYSEVFNPKLLVEAHSQCIERVSKALAGQRENICVTNTFTKKWELQPYLDLAAHFFDCRVFILTIERHHQGTNDHGASDEVIQQMAQRWEHVDPRMG